MSLVLRNKFLRAFFTFSRMIYFIKIKGNMKSLETNPQFVAEKTLRSNRRRVIEDNQLPAHPTARTLLGLDLDVIGGKSMRFIDFAKFFYSGRVKDKKVLLIGPRNEAEIFTFLGNGFGRKTLFSIDLFSYSPLINIMDMHNLKFADNEFDIVYAGWVISYSENRTKAISEMLRVTRPGGVVGITATLSPVSNEDLIAKRGYMVGSKNRLQNLTDLSDLFLPFVENGNVILLAPTSEDENAGLACFRKSLK